MLNIVADENMPHVRELFGDLGNVQLLPGRAMTPEQISDADVLLVRSVTRVNAALLAKATRLKFVGTATIGTDHIDKALLADRQIAFTVRRAAIASRWVIMSPVRCWCWPSAMR